MVRLPLSWHSCAPSTAVVTESKREAEVKVPSSHPLLGDMPWTVQYAGCHQRGKNIELPIGFLAKNKSVEAKGSLLAREWVKLQFGVFEENGFDEDNLYPTTFSEGKNNVTNAGCEVHDEDQVRGDGGDEDVEDGEDGEDVGDDGDEDVEDVEDVGDEDVEPGCVGAGACYRELIWLPLPHDLCFSKLIGFQSLISLLFFVLLLLLKPYQLKAGSNTTCSRCSAQGPPCTTRTCPQSRTSSATVRASTRSWKRLCSKKTQSQPHP